MYRCHESGQTRKQLLLGVQSPSRNRMRQGKEAELGEAVKGQEVGIVSVVGAALVIVKSRAAGGDDVLAIEQPVHVLEAVSRDVRMMEQDATHLPIQQF